MFQDTHAAPAMTRAASRGKSRRSLDVLIADDNAEFRTELSNYMRRLPGYRVVGEASDGLEIVSMTQQFHPDLVLMDISMPGMNGVGAARKIKEFSSTTKIVFVTIHENKTFQVLSDMLGMEGVVCKSSLLKELPGVLDRVCGTIH
jgi:DNA-binding NarL/FixJ family response regulator